MKALTLVLALLAAAASGAAAQGAAPPTRLPSLTWGQSEEVLFVQVTVPPPVEPVEVWFNDSHVRLAVDGGEQAVRYALEFELREDVRADNSTWFVNRNGLKLNLRKRCPHRFDRLLARARASPSHSLS